MNKLFYWQSWRQPYKLIFWILFVIFMILVLSVLVLQIIGSESWLGWHVLTQETSFTYDYLSFAKGPFDFSIQADKKILSELFSGSEMPSTSIASNILIIVIITCLLLYTTIATYFSRLWYLVAMGGLLTFLILLHVESVGLFGWNDTRVLLIVFAFILIPGYYLHAFRYDSSFRFRIIAMAISMASLGLIVYLFGASEHPYANLLNYGMLAPYLIIIIFIFSVAHEIIAFFVNTISATENIENTVKIRHFLIITGIYLANILLSFLYITHNIDWQIFYINPFVLLIISAVLGVWGSRLRASLYQGASKHEVLWPMFYLVLAIASLATIVFFMIALNDPFLKVLGDLVLYTHLAIGIAFLLYILYNFISVIEKGFDLRKVLYKPTNFPYFTYRILGVIIVIGLFAVRGFDYPVWYSMAGFNNAKADMVLEDGFLDIAEAYYQNGETYAYHNHKSNYSLAMLYADKEPSKAIIHFDNAKDRQPTSQTLLNKANLENLQQDYYSALFTLQEGVDILPGNLHLYNNLAWQFATLKLADSAEYYMQLAGTSNDVIKANRLGLAAILNKPLGADSADLFKDLSRAGYANASAHGYFKETPELSTADHMYDMVLLNNWLLTDLTQLEGGSLAEAKVVIDSTKDSDYKHQLLYSWAIANYSSGNKSQAIESLIELSYNAIDWEIRAKLALAMIYLQSRAYEQSFLMLTQLKGTNQSFPIAISLLENGDLDEAFNYWQEAAETEDTFLAGIASDILEAVYQDQPVLDTDQKKYLYGRYRKYYIDEGEENKLLKEIQTEDLRIDLALDLAEFYHQYDNDGAAKMILKNIEGLSLNTEEYTKYLIYQALADQESDNVQEQINKIDEISGFKPRDYIIENTLNHLAGITLDSTDYINMAIDDPFFPDAILIGAEHFKDDDDYFRSYSYLAKAVQLNPDSPKLMQAYILKALEVGLDQFAENALYEFSQKHSGQVYLVLKKKYDAMVKEMNILSEIEPLD